MERLFLGGDPTGTSENISDLIPPKVLKHKMISFIPTEDTFQCYLVFEDHKKSFAGSLKLCATPGNVYLNDSNFN